MIKKLHFFSITFSLALLLSPISIAKDTTGLFEISDDAKDWVEQNASILATSVKGFAHHMMAFDDLAEIAEAQGLDLPKDLSEEDQIYILGVVQGEIDMVHQADEEESMLQSVLSQRAIQHKEEEVDKMVVMNALMLIAPIAMQKNAQNKIISANLMRVVPFLMEK